MADPVVLSYHDSILRQSDLVVLEPPNWINDNIIAFAFQYFQEKIYTGRNIFLLDPSVAQMAKLCSSPFEIEALLSSLELPKKDLVLIAINDNNETKAGGSHWSLLAWRNKQFFHFDSSGNLNNEAVMATATALSGTLGVPVPVTVAQIPVQAQRNAYDCGMFVLEIAFQLLKRKFDSSSKTAKPEDLLSWAKKDLNVAEMRVYLKTTIAHLAAESTPLSPLLQRPKKTPVLSYRHQLDEALEKLTFEEVSHVASDFHLTTKLNQAAAFQYGKVESELGAVIARQAAAKSRNEQIGQLETKLDELLDELINTEANVVKLDKYSRELEEAVKKHFCK